MENDEVLDAGEKKVTEAPGFLKTLCILTWIGSGLGALAYLLLVVAFGVIADALADLPGLGGVLGGGIAIFAVLLLAAVGKIVAAAQMWKLKKTGFYIYTVCELTAFILGYILVKDVPADQGGGFPTMALVFSAAFIAMYAANLKHMK